jgi:hypothetical protein
MPAKARPANDSTGATLGFEAKLWKPADALRNNMDAAEYKHVVGLILPGHEWFRGPVAQPQAPNLRY